MTPDFDQCLLLSTVSVELSTSTECAQAVGPQVEGGGERCGGGRWEGGGGRRRDSESD